MFSPSPLTDAIGQAQPQDRSGLHLLLPVPVGAARFGVPILYLFWVHPSPPFFWTEREHRSVFLGKRQDTKNQGRGCSHQPWWIRLYVSQYPGDSGQVAPVKPTHSRALVMTGRGDRPWSLGLPSQVCVPELGRLNRAPPSPQVWDPSKPGLVMPCGLSASVYCHWKDVPTHVLWLQSPDADWEVPYCLPLIPMKP